MVVIRHPKMFCFNFDWPKDVDENFRHKITFIIETNESLAENKTKKRDWTCLNISMQIKFMNSDNSKKKKKKKKFSSYLVGKIRF